MKYQNIIVYLVIPLALLSIPSLLENVQAQTNSVNQTAPQHTKSKHECHHSGINESRYL